MIFQLLNKKKITLPKEEYPKYFNLKVNKSVARSLGIFINNNNHSPKEEKSD